MKKNIETTVEELQIGDRFYRMDDKKKACWTKVEHKSSLPRLKHHIHWALRDAGRYPLAMNEKTKVVFLRHLNDNINTLKNVAPAIIAAAV